MKRLLPFVVSILTLSAATAQETGNSALSGTVIYQQTDQLDIQLEGDAAQFASALPKERKSEKILQFGEGAALYQNHVTEKPEEVTEMAGGGAMMIRMVEPDNKMYTDLQEEQQIEQREFMSRIFLIQKEPVDMNWKLTGNQRVILGYPCQEALSESEPAEGEAGEEGRKVTAWFTPQIAVPAGPGAYGGLPGLVLAVDINGGKQVIEAVSVEMGPVDKALLKKPKKGKKVNDEEFQAIVKEKMEEMGAEHGEGGNYTFTVRVHQ